MEPLTTDPYENVDLVERVRNDKIFDALCRRGIKRAMLAHQAHNVPVVVWRDGKVVLISASEALKQIDAA